MVVLKDGLNPNPSFRKYATVCTCMKYIKLEPVVSTVVLSFRFTKDRFFGCHNQEHTCRRDVLSHLPTGLVRLDTMRPITRGAFNHVVCGTPRAPDTCVGKTNRFRPKGSVTVFQRYIRRHV